PIEQPYGSAPMKAWALYMNNIIFAAHHLSVKSIKVVVALVVRHEAKWYRLTARATPTHQFRVPSMPAHDHRSLSLQSYSCLPSCEIPCDCAIILSLTR